MQGGDDTTACWNPHKWEEMDVTAQHNGAGQGRGWQACPCRQGMR